MKAKNIRWILKNIPSKIFLLFWFFSLIIGLVYASSGLFLGLPSSPSQQQTPWGTFSGRFANIKGTCPTDAFLKGLDANLNRICVPSTGVYNWWAISKLPVASLWGYPGALAGQYAGGKFGTYFHNLSGLCSDNTIVKGFASDGTKYCVDPTTPTVYTPLYPTTPSGVSWPSNDWGEFQDFFTTMFQTCSGSGVVNGFNTNGTPSCMDIPPPPTFIWSTWLYWECSATCGWWSQTRTVVCLRNDGVVVVDTNCWWIKPTDSQSCNTEACPPPPPSACSPWYHMVAYVPANMSCNPPPYHVCGTCVVDCPGNQGNSAEDPICRCRTLANNSIPLEGESCDCPSGYRLSGSHGYDACVPIPSCGSTKDTCNNGSVYNGSSSVSMDGKIATWTCSLGTYYASSYDVSCNATIP